MSFSFFSFFSFFLFFFLFWPPLAPLVPRNGGALLSSLGDFLRAVCSLLCNYSVLQAVLLPFLGPLNEPGPGMRGETYDEGITSPGLRYPMNPPFRQGPPVPYPMAPARAYSCYSLQVLCNPLDRIGSQGQGGVVHLPNHPVKHLTFPPPLNPILDTAVGESFLLSVGH